MMHGLHVQPHSLVVTITMNGHQVTYREHTAPELNLGLKKISIKTECAAMWRMNIRSF